MPRLNGKRRTRTPFAAAAPAVSSAEPSSITTISISGSALRISSITPPIEPSSLYAGTSAIRRSAASRGSTAPGASRTASATDGHRRRAAEPEQLEQPARAMDVRVLVEGPLARGPAELLRAARIVEQRAVRLHSLVRARHDEQLPPRLEPALDPLVRIGDDSRSGHGQLERARGGRGRNRRVGAT